MTDLKNVRDSFLHFLYDNLTPGGIPVHPVREDPNEPEASVLKDNAVSVEYLDVKLSSGKSGQMVAIDILHDSENTAMDWMTSVWILMRAQSFTPLLDYSNTSNPVGVGNNIYWDSKNLKFTKVAHDTHYTHYHCLLTLNFFAN